MFQLLKEKNFTRLTIQEIGLTLVRTVGLIGPSVGDTTRKLNFTTTQTVGVRLGMINFGLGTLGAGMLRGILGVGLRTLLRTFGLDFGGRSFGDGRNFGEA